MLIWFASQSSLFVYHWISALLYWVIGSSLPSDLNMSAQAIDVSSCLNVDSCGGPSCGALSLFSKRFIHRGSISDGIPSC